MHELRGTLGSWLARTGASLILIGKGLNHKDQAATAIHARLDLDPMRQSVDRAAPAIFEAAGIK
ncbi:MAG: tyrosine-type recombinase/integrase, partial [Rubrivivax sp.]